MDHGSGRTSRQFDKRQSDGYYSCEEESEWADKGGAPSCLPHLLDSITSALTHSSPHKAGERTSVGRLSANGGGGGPGEGHEGVH